jgi:hypothetical protein
MVWLKMTGQNGNGFYLDVHDVEQRRLKGETVFALSATFGDGMFESPVLIEVGREVEVVFVDQWLAEKKLQDFFHGIDREEVEAALREAASSMTFCVENFPSLEGKPRNEVVGLRAEGYTVALPAWQKARQLDLPMVVCEKTVEWQVAG